METDVNSSTGAAKSRTIPVVVLGLGIRAAVAKLRLRAIGRWIIPAFLAMASLPAQTKDPGKSVQCHPQIIETIQIRDAQEEDENLRINVSGRHLLAIAGEYTIPAALDPEKLLHVTFDRFFQGPFFQSTLPPGGPIQFPSYDPRNDRAFIINDVVVKSAVFSDGSFCGDDFLKYELERRALNALAYLDYSSGLFERMEPSEIESLLINYSGRGQGDLPDSLRTVGGDQAAQLYRALRELLLHDELLSDDELDRVVLHRNYLARLSLAKTCVIDYLDLSRHAYRKSYLR